MITYLVFTYLNSLWYLHRQTDNSVQFRLQANNTVMRTYLRALSHLAVHAKLNMRWKKLSKHSQSLLLELWLPLSSTHVVAPCSQCFSGKCPAAVKIKASSKRPNAIGRSLTQMYNHVRCNNRFTIANNLFRECVLVLHQPMIVIVWGTYFIFNRFTAGFSD